MTNWKYKVQGIRLSTNNIDEDIQDALDIEGPQGWELVTIKRFQGLSPSFIAIYKRPIE